MNENLKLSTYQDRHKAVCNKKVVTTVCLESFLY